MKVKTYQELQAEGMIPSTGGESFLVEIWDIGGNSKIYRFPENIHPVELAKVLILLGDDDWWGICELALYRGANPEDLLDVGIKIFGEHVSEVWLKCIIQYDAPDA